MKINITTFILKNKRVIYTGVYIFYKNKIIIYVFAVKFQVMRRISKLTPQVRTEMLFGCLLSSSHLTKGCSI